MLLVGYDIITQGGAIKRQSKAIDYIQKRCYIYNKFSGSQDLQSLKNVF